jgi:hypothetical protein
LPLVLLFAAVAVVKPMGIEPAWLDARHGLTVLRVGHAVLVLLLYLSLLTLLGGWLRRQPFAAVAAIGRRSLDTFAGGVLLTYGLGTLVLRLGSGHGVYLAAVAVGIAATVVLAYALDVASNRRPAR